MNSDNGDNSDTGTKTSRSVTGTRTDATQANVERAAQKAHEAVDRAAQTVRSGTDRVMNLQEEYGETAREQIRANPLAVVVGAFAIGYLFAKITR
jgi:ElaB/YqjD/DUF883 family membrane-anchored ribosome-binding protein